MEILFSKYELIIKTENGSQFIFDVIRKKYVVLTPEEWVRQHIVHYLIHDYLFPKSLISLEKKLVLNELVKRTDIVLFNRKGKPVLIVECKSESVNLSQKTFEQIARYNLKLEVPFLWVSNGKINHLCKIDLEIRKFSFLSSLPPVSDLV